MERKSSAAPVIITILLIIALCCLGICLVIFASGAAFVTWWDIAEPTIVVVDQPLPKSITTPSVDLTPTKEPTTTPTATQEAPVPAGQETLITLNEVIIPINDPNELAERLGGKSNIPKTFPDPNAPYRIGDSKAFWVINVDNHENFQVTATVRYLGENVYFWIENGVTYAENDLTALGDTFDQEIYPTTQEFFGSEWSPGVDHDPHIHILYAGGLGQSLAGYYSSADQLHPDAHEFSNAHEMFLINSDNVDLGRDYIYGTLAHEYQHMIHWYVDRNEETWLNEGFSMLSELINGYDPGGFDYLYIRDTDLQLTDWGDAVGENGPHYGAAMLFTTYFYDRFGKEVTQALVAHEKNGLASIDAVLSELDILDPLTNETITAVDFFSDWAVTNYLSDSNVADGRYHYNVYPSAPTASPKNSISACPASRTDHTVAQFGVDYIEISCNGDYTLKVSGSTSSAVLPINPYSGEYYFWSNMGDHSNMSLERRFDFTDVSPPIEMTFQTWYDIEKDYDYVYISASIDDENWQILNTTSCTTSNPSGNNYDCGLHGQSNGWQEEIVNLDAFSGQEITLRFDYVTDAAVNGDGMVIDDIRIDAIDFFTDFEENDGGWQGAGFVRIQNILPQTFQITMITFSEETIVTPLVMDEDNQLEIDISIGEEVDSIVLVVSGTTAFTRQRAEYQIEIH
jgi:immune inhibitor A